jgi:carbon-monoxide dehydrogenase medium subunit
VKLASLEYACPATLPEAVALLAANDGSKVIAGGQSLMPMLAFRVASPGLLVDLRKLPGMRHIDVSSDGVHLGALVRWRDIEEDVRLATAHPLLLEAVRHVAHYQIRNRGTIGGSLAHADPAAEAPGIAVTCEAEILTFGTSGTRTIAAANFFLGALTTALSADEVITEIRFPAWPTGRRWAFREFARRLGDFALAAVALFYDEEDGRARNVHVGVVGVGDCPQRLPGVEALLEDQIVDEGTIAEAERIAAASVTPPDDIHASAPYRRALVGTLVERALRAAAA